jgi:hypothetical protein
MSNYIDEDIFCTTSPLDSTLFPVGSTKFLDRTYNVLPFLCDLLKYANDETISPVLVEPPEFDITPFTDYTGLTGVGDPRASLGDTMQATFINFLPRMIAQTEVFQSGGTQVVENVICDAEGQPIKTSSTIPALLSLDLTGKKPYQYGSLSIPPITQTIEELLRPIEPQEVIDYVTEYVKSSKQEQVIYFARFITEYFLVNGWAPTLIAYEQPPVFLIKLTKDNNVTYIKYFPDVKHQVGCALGIRSIETYIGNTSLDDRGMVAAMGNEIPNYKFLMLESPEKTRAWYEYLITFNVSNINNNYTTMLTNSAKALEYINTLFSTTTTSTVSSLSTVQVDCSLA